jgi:hypothetical protein
MVRALIAAIAAAALLAMAGCGGSGTEGTSTSASGAGVLPGQWKGRLHQQGLEPFTVTATIASPTGSAGNEVHYTGIDCSGRWSFLGSRGSEHRFREVIDRGRGGKCKGVGTVTLTTTAAADRLGYEFRGGGVTSRGTLRRTAGR